MTTKTIIKPVTTYKVALQRLDGIGDKLGMPIDEKIKPLVAALNMWSVETSASCEGHAGRALPYPWVDIPYAHVETAGRLLCIPNIDLKLSWFFEPFASGLRWRPGFTARVLWAMQDEAKSIADVLAGLDFE
jgi:hypothetical protein